MEIIYIHHDAFVVKSSCFTAIFDYWMMPAGHSVEELFRLVDPHKPLYVIVSHHHKDHYNPSIFSWVHRFENIRFIMSRDTVIAARKYFYGTHYKGNRRIDASLVSELRAGDVFDDGIIKIEAFHSTDIGNSYVLTSLSGADAGRTVFFAGDLNAWTWRDESTQQEVNKAIGDFKAVLRDISGAGHSCFSVALFPVDARIGSGYYDGAKIFLEKFDVGVFVPMHFVLAEDAAEASRFKMKAMQFGRYASPHCMRYILLDAFESVSIHTR